MKLRDVSVSAVLLTGAVVFMSQTPLSLPERTEMEYRRPPVSFTPQRNATILFGGDLMFDRSVRQVMEREGADFIFSCMTETLEEPDLVVANLEGPITEYPSMSVGSVIGSPQNFTFTFPTETASMLARHNISLVNLGNNHIRNFGSEGVVQTKRFLDEANVRYFGTPDVPEHERVAELEIGGIPFSFVNWSDWTSEDVESVIAEIKKAAESDRVTVVYTHWGEEYIEPTPRVKDLARAFVDAGAEIVIGSHPHVVQEHEMYHGKYVYYSLGNFVFDQYWNDEVSTGLLLKVTFSKDGVSGVREIPIKLGRDRRTCLL